MHTGSSSQVKPDPIQVKICGITTVDDGWTCVNLGADAVGLVFYPPSPRFVSLEQAVHIVSGLPPRVAKVGVFVNESYDTIMHTVSSCRLSAVQLHGQESPELVERLAKNAIVVIKCLYLSGQPGLDAVSSYNAPAFLVECSAGKLPGGNAKIWDWSAARDFAKRYPTIIAGGLTPENVAQAIAAARPSAVDVSSGVESVPGRKESRKVREFISAVHQSTLKNPTRRIF
ncbi:MAG: phosphoribosylanthranilate isomerase [Desulfovermiculus sp.]|nr:phosphoribosylanthranilate isomerase [Desulfovermiculus sp.]